MSETTKPEMYSPNYVRPSLERDLRDLASLAMGMMRIARCPGGRYTTYGYVCMHCGVDYTLAENEGFCGQPVGEDSYTPFDATVARRIMLESMAEHGEADDGGA